MWRLRKKKRLVLKRKGDQMQFVRSSSRSRSNKIVEEDNQIYNTAGIEVKPEFPGGMAKFYKYVGKTIVPEEEGKVYVTLWWKRWFIN
jgi:hypothetical protein